MTIDSEIEEILLQFEHWLKHPQSTLYRHHDISRTMLAIQKWAAQEANKARISELEKLKLDTLMPENFGGRFIHEPVTEFAKQQTEWINDRIAQLTVDKEQAE